MNGVSNLTATTHSNLYLLTGVQKAIMRARCATLAHTVEGSFWACTLLLASQGCLCLQVCKLKELDHWMLCLVDWGYSTKQEREKKRKFTPLGVITGASRPRGSPKLLS